MKIKIGGMELDTEDDTVILDPMLQSAVDHVKANESDFTENEEFEDIASVLAKGG